MNIFYFCKSVADKIFIALVVQQSTSLDQVHIDARFGHLTLPGHCINIHGIAGAHQFTGDAQHIALYPAKREILENKKCKSQFGFVPAGKGLIVCENVHV